jgi:hypothetical protein
MKRTLIKYLKKSDDYKLIESEVDNITMIKKALKHDILLFFRKAYIRRYLSEHREHHNARVAKYMKEKYHENKDGYKAKKIEQINKNYIKNKAIRNSTNDLEYLLN